MAVSLTNLCSPMHSSSPPRVGFYKFHFRIAHGCHINFSGLKNGGKIKGKTNFAPAINRLTVTRCISNVVQLEQSSDIYKDATGACVEADRSSNVGSKRLDKNGRFRSPRAARELALVVLYEACVEGSDPLRLFERRMNMKNATSARFDRTLLEYYDHMRFSGTPLYTETEEQARVLQMDDEKEALTEAAVLAAPLKLVYNKFVLSMAKKILKAVVERWDEQAANLDETVPSKWKVKDESAGRILELCIMHIAMAEIVVLGTRYQVVINEAIDLAKRFCDGASPRIINGCLRSFIVKENFVAKIPSQSLRESQLQSTILETSNSSSNAT